MAPKLAPMPLFMAQSSARQRVALRSNPWVLRLAHSALLALAAASLPGCSSTTPKGEPIPSIADSINATIHSGERPLTPGDVLRVTFPNTPQWSHDTRISPDGRASFLSVGEFVVAGMSLSELQVQLTGAYSEILAQPDVTVQVNETAIPNFHVTGEVMEAGSYAVATDRTSLVEAIAMAGGYIRDTAQLEHTLLVRWIPDEGRVASWSIDARPEHWGSEATIWLQPHDVLFVPAKPVVHVNDWIDRYIRRMIPFPYLLPGL